MHKQSGFTLAEGMVATAAIVIACVLVFSQWQYMGASQRDTKRKVAINTIHYYLEEVYFKKNQSYPSYLTASDLTSLNDELIKDPYGRAIGDQASDLHYTPGNCVVNACARYELRANLEKEDDFIRVNQSSD